MDNASVTVLGSRRQGGDKATLFDNARAKLLHDIGQATFAPRTATRARRARESEPRLA